MLMKFTALSTIPSLLATAYIKDAIRSLVMVGKFLCVACST